MKNSWQWATTYDQISKTGYYLIVENGRKYLGKIRNLLSPLTKKSTGKFLLVSFSDVPVCVQDPQNGSEWVQNPVFQRVCVSSH